MEPANNLEELAQSIAEALAPLIKPDPATTYTIDEVAGMLHLTRSTAFRRKKADNWPCIRIGTTLLFDEENIKQIIELYREKPAPEKVVPNVGIRARKRNSK